MSNPHPWGSLDWLFHRAGRAGQDAKAELAAKRNARQTAKDAIIAPGRERFLAATRIETTAGPAHALSLWPPTRKAGVHLVPDGGVMALCGAKPAEGGEWDEIPFVEATCRRCLKTSLGSATGRPRIT